jgi:rRNA biogenesis protein RRP5
LDAGEVAFPRGGASALTALELKEVANEAARDVLFESSTAVTKSKDEQRPNKKKKVNANKAADKNEIPIETLSFKNMIPGTLVLGQIAEISRWDMAIALPDNLTGFVPITSISSILTETLEELDESEEEESDNNEEDSTKITSGVTSEKKFPELSKLFKVGQWVRTMVVESTSTANKKKSQKKRIQLSIEPEKVNKVLETDDLVVNTTLQVAVKSIEDHGAILDLGKEIGGFISNKEIKAASLDPGQILPGSVFLATISNNNSRTVTVKLTSNKKNVASTISSVESVVPGNLVEALITEVEKNGLVSKVYGMLDATFNLAHIGVYEYDSLKHKFAVGSKVKARVLAVILANDSKKLLLSTQQNVLNFGNSEVTDALEAFPIGHVFDNVEVKGHDSNYIYVKVDGDRFGEVHISRIDNEKSSLETFYASGSTHPARVIGYSPLDNFYSLTFDPAIIKQKYLRAQDIPLGESVSAEVIAVSEQGLKVKVFGKFEATVPALHMSDIKLIYPERKFKIGSKVKGRILDITKFKNEIIVTLRKSLVGIEHVVTSLENARVGDRTSVTVISFKPSGAIVSFFGNLKAYLPKSEISETFVRRPEDHLRLGQTITVRIATVDKESQRITVSCRLSEESTEAQKKALTDLLPGQSVVKAHVVEKTKESVVVELPGSNLRGVIFAGHLSDGNYEQNRAILKRLQVGSSIEGLVLDKDARSRIFNLSAKKSLIDAVQTGIFPTKFKDIKVSDELIPGYVKSVTDKGVFVGFGFKLVGLILAKYATDRQVDDLSSIFRVNQSVAVRVLRVDEENKRFLLTLKEKNTDSNSAVNPVDNSIKSFDDLKPGKITKVVVKSVKHTQLNVQIADNIQGRVDVSEIFDNYDEIKDPRHPLSQFKKGDVLDVKVIGYHDARNHRFLPITHKKNSQIIIELSAKKSVLKSDRVEQLSLDKIEVGSGHLAFINNSAKSQFFVSISPTIKGKISFMNLSNNAALLHNIDETYPIGCALKATVKSVDVEYNAVVLTAREDAISSIEDVKTGMNLPARIIRVAESFVIVELADKLTAISFVTDALNDYTKKLEDVFEKNDIVAASVLDVDTDNKKIFVSLRTNDTSDKLIRESGDLQRGDVVRGFVKNISDKGLFISVGRTVTAYVKIGDLSDSFIKEWKKFYKIHQPVIGKIVNADSEGHVTMTLKESEVNGELNILKRYEDLEVGDIFEGSVKRVTDFGVFVKLDGTLNLSGLCHHSEISDNQVQNLTALFGEGDRVKVKVLSLNREKKQMSLGMKASYFQDDIEMEDVEEHESEDEEIHSPAAEANSDEEEVDFDSSAFDDQKNAGDSDGSSESEVEMEEGLSGLRTNGFDWTASILDQVQDDETSDEEDFTEIRSKKKKKSKQIVEDTTGDINSKAPQSVADFERLIIGNPNSSIVWMNYMSFQLQLSEVEKAREIGERALKTINYREEQEKLNIWIALLNLENTFGTEETLEDVFKRANEYMEPSVIHQKMVSIYILSEKYDGAESLFKSMAKKFGKSSTSLWVSYGSFLLDRGNDEKAREILANALSALPKRDHIEVVRKFAQLEFSKGDAEHGRTLFEGLIADVPKRIDLWNVYIDQEMKKNENKKVRDLFERVITKKVSRKQAKFFFAKWLAFEEKCGDSKAVDYVKAKAQEYVQKNDKA